MKVTIKEIYDNLETYTANDRMRILVPLIEQLSPVSQKTLIEFQEKEFFFPPFPELQKTFYEEYFKKQNVVFKQCIELETAEIIGDPVREQFKLQPLRMESEIEVGEPPSAN